MEPDSRDPPPLMPENESIDKSEDDDDLFASAVNKLEENLSNNDEDEPVPPLVESAPVDESSEAEKPDDAHQDQEPAEQEAAKSNQPAKLDPDDFFGGEEVDLTSPEDEAPKVNGAESAASIEPEPLDEQGDKPAAVPVAAPRATVMSTPDEEKEGADDLFMEISVSNPSKVGDGMGAYMVYKVSTKTNIPEYKKKNLSVSRRFSDFLGLHEKLAYKYMRLGRIVPPAPEKSVIGMTKVKMSKEEDATLAQDEFVERRRAALERYLNRTAAHPVLRVDTDFKQFVELETELPKATSTSALSSAGVKRLFNMVGDSMNKMTYKMDESDEWFEEKQQQLENLDNQLRKLHCSIETLVHHRKQLSHQTASFAKSAAMLGNAEENTALSRAMSQLAETEEKVEKLHDKQANSDFFMFSELLKDYVSLVGAVREVFHQRVKVFQSWEHSQQTLTRKREAEGKLQLAGKADKVKLEQAKAEISEWETNVQKGQAEFEQISKIIRKEVERFEKQRVEDFKSALISYLESLMDDQQELIQYWETFLPEAKAIA